LTIIAKKKQEVLGRTNLPTFPMATVAIVPLVKTVCDETTITQQLNNPKPLLCKAENHASN
jgi:hypothetical protein